MSRHKNYGAIYWDGAPDDKHKSGQMHKRHIANGAMRRLVEKMNEDHNFGFTQEHPKSKKMSLDQPVQQAEVAELPDEQHAWYQYLPRASDILPIHLTPDNEFYRIAQLDYDWMNRTNVIDVTPEVRRLYLLHAVRGHAAAGHSYFREHGMYPNVTMHDVCKGVGIDDMKVKITHQVVIDQIIGYLERVFKDPKDSSLEHLLDEDDSPLAGSLVLGKIACKDPLALCRMFYADGHKDNYTWRQATAEEFGISIGGGETCAIDMERLRAANLTLEDLSHNDHDESQMVGLRSNGIILTEDEIMATPQIAHGYVRRKVGKGVSDDFSVLAGGLMLNHGHDKLSGAAGSVLADAIDTLEKFAPMVFRQGQDEIFADMINYEFKRKGVELLSDRQVREYIYLSSTQGYPRHMPDSSQRYLHLRQGGQPCALSMHMRLLSGEPLANLEVVPLSMDRIPSDQAYALWMKRYKEFSGENAAR